MTTIPSCGLDPQLELPSDYLVQEDWWSCNYTICQDPKIRPYTPSVLFSVLLLVLIPALLVVIPKQRGHKVSRSDFSSVSPEVVSSCFSALRNAPFSP